MSLQTTNLGTVCDLVPQADGCCPKQSIIENFRLILLDTTREELIDDSSRRMVQLRRLVDSVEIFTDVDQCIDSLTEIKRDQVLMILSTNNDQYLIDLIDDLPQLNSIYLLSKEKSLDEVWTKNCSKIQGIFTKIELIYPLLRQITRQNERDSVSINFVSDIDGRNPNLNELDQSFMYTQLLKEILLEMNYDQQSLRDLIVYWRSQYVDNHSELRKIEHFENEYDQLESPIWWYTYSNFLYSMLNRALRVLDVDIILKMGFFIRDLHRNIEQLHFEQFGNSPKVSLLVYRGQGLSKSEFEKIRQTKGGLISFNNFLSTSTDRDVSYVFADSNQHNSRLIGILFEIAIDTAISLAPFANIDNFSSFTSEKEILFSMNTIFRIGQINHIDDNQRLWEVKLTLTNDNDPQLAALTEQMRKETGGHAGWLRLVKLLNKLGHFSKSENVCQLLLNQTTDDSVKMQLYHILGSIKDEQGDYQQACSFLERSLEMHQKTLFPNHPALITLLNNIAAVYKKLGNHSKALSYYEKVIEVRERTLPPNHPDLAISYNNLGFMFFEKNESSKAISYYEKALGIYQESLPANHPFLSSAYNNLAGVYNKMGEYDTALSYLEVSLDIDRKILPSNHPDLAARYNNIGRVHSNMQEYAKAIPFYENAIQIAKHLLPDNHPNLRTYIKNLQSARKKLAINHFN